MPVPVPLEVPMLQLAMPACGTQLYGVSQSCQHDTGSVHCGVLAFISVVHVTRPCFQTEEIGNVPYILSVATHSATCWLAPAPIARACVRVPDAKDESGLLSHLSVAARQSCVELLLCSSSSSSSRHTLYIS